jgi:hypothetical protein
MLMILPSSCFFVERDIILRTYIEYLNFCPIVWIGSPSKRECLPHTWVLGERHNRFRGRGGGGPNSNDWTETPVLYICSIIPLRLFVCTFHLFDWLRKWETFAQRKVQGKPFRIKVSLTDFRRSLPLHIWISNISQYHIHWLNRWKNNWYRDSLWDKH